MKEYNHCKRIQKSTNRSPFAPVRYITIVLITLLMGCGKKPRSLDPAPVPDLAIHEAVIRGDLESIKAHIASGSDLDQLDNLSQNTPLMTAATFGRVNIAKELINAGANLDIKNNDGSTALISAAFFCQTEIVQALLDHGADTKIRNRMGSTALNSVEGPWEAVKPIYDMLGAMLAPSGVILDYKRIQSTRPKIAEMLQDSEAPELPIKNAPEFEVKKITPTGEEPYLHLDSDYIFDQEMLHTFELNIPGSALSKLDADPSAEEYVEGSLSFEGQTLSPVGIRYKGSVGAWAGCLSGPDWVNPSGHKVCNKLSLKIKINWNGSDQKFYGLKKLQLHSQKSDRSQMRERLGYWLFRNMGVAAPRSVHARVVINGTYSGLYALTEQIDGRFSRHHFEDGTGNIYKEIWPLDSEGNARDEATFLKHLKTNKDKNPSAELMGSFAQAIAASKQTELQSVIRQWMNIDEIISYAVVDRVIRHDDGPFHWYCHGNECFNHNYYWYENPIEQKLHLVPWDLDNTFENIMSDINPVTAIADGWGEVTDNGSPFNFGPFNLPQRSAASDKLIGGWASFEKEFDEQLNRFLMGPFSKTQIDHLLDTWMEQIREATAEAHDMHKDAMTVAEWEGAVNDLRIKVDFARTKHLGQSNKPSKIKMGS